jgi:VanZ family protein
MSTPGRRAPRVDAGPELRLARFWWAVGWAIVIFITVSCLEPPRYVPNLHLWDKLEHASAFFGMTCWFGGLVRRKRYLLVVFWMLLFGASIEVVQGLMRVGRTADVWDFAADSVGVTVALTLLYLGLGSWTRWIEQLAGLSREPAGP